TLKDYTGQRHPKVRVAAVRALGQTTDVRGLLVLFRLLRDPSPDVVSAAVSSLVQTRTAEAVAPLVCLTALNPATTLALQAALTELDSTEVGSFAQKLQELLRHPFPPVAAVAVRLLTKITGDAQLKTLVRLLGKHPSGEVRAAAVECLGELKRKQSVTHLNAALRDSDFRVRAAAAVAMESLHSPKSVQLLVAALRDADTTVRRNAARTLTTIDDERIAKAASEAIEDQTDSQTIEYLLEIIGQGGTEAALKTLQRYLNGEDIGFRHRAINTLKKLKNPKSVDLLIPFLADPNATTRELAVKAVGALGSRSPLPKLRELLKTDKEVKVRAATARALGELKDSKSLLALEEALHDDRMVACQAVIALGETGQKAAIPALLGQLRNPAADIRMHACGALAQIGGLERTQPLEALLNDHDPAVRRSAETALTKLGVNYRKVRLGIHVRKALVNLMPGSVSGAIPMGTVSVAAVALLVLVSAGWGLWSGLSLASGPELRVSNINAMAISHDGRQVAISRRYQVYDLWDTTTGQLRTRGATSFDALSMVFLSDSSTVLVSGGKSYRWRIEGDDPEIGPEAFSEVQSKISSGPSCVTADGRFLATATIKGQVTVTDLSTGEVFGKQVSFRDFRRDCSIAITPDGALIVAAGTNGAIQIGSTEEGSVVANVNVARVLPPEHKFSTTAVAVDSSGKFLALGSLEGEVIILDLEEGLSVVGTPAQDASRIVALRFPSEGTRLRIVTVAKGLLISEEDFSVAKSLSSRPLDVPQSVCFSADGNLAAISFSDSSAFSVIDFERDKVLVEDAGG
ncbi:MAG: HEAT repeat domain-containing protein, partial [Planctomycetaceae bacterium]|nr:HEAT repeat domain-containing protein [Planctomycetaceae bacterium]